LRQTRKRERMISMREILCSHVIVDLMSGVQSGFNSWSNRTVFACIYLLFRKWHLCGGDPTSKRGPIAAGLPPGADAARFNLDFSVHVRVHLSAPCVRLHACMQVK
jgi:hypothetical protein